MVDPSVSNLRLCRTLRIAFGTFLRPGSGSASGEADIGAILEKTLVVVVVFDLRTHVNVD